MSGTGRSVLESHAKTQRRKDRKGVHGSIFNGCWQDAFR